VESRPLDVERHLKDVESFPRGAERRPKDTESGRDDKNKLLKETIKMPKVNVKEIREECDRMSAGWENSPDTEFNGIKKEEFDAERAAARALDAEIEADEAATKAKKTRRDGMYRGLGDKKVKVRKGVSGHKDFGEDSPLYGSMGFILESERKSGLHRGGGGGGTQ
jgi:hypothetical protein